ncbi:MAG: hypothetical protein S0880_14930 [Actinomycetota bacterium]|nr:hypothetical protein [Actinomycetota bacterium]
MLDRIGQRVDHNRRRKAGLGTVVALGLCGIAAFAVAAGGVAADLAFPPPVSVEGSVAAPLDTTTATPSSDADVDRSAPRADAPTNSLPAPARPADGDGSMVPLDEEGGPADPSSPAPPASTPTTTGAPATTAVGTPSTVAPEPSTTRLPVTTTLPPTTRPPTTAAPATTSKPAPSPQRPKLTIRPSDGLGHEQQVEVVGTGYPAGSDQRLEVCSLSGCQALATPVVTDADGRLQARLRLPRVVYPGPQPTDCAGSPHVCVLRAVPGSRSATASMEFDSSAPAPEDPTLQVAPTEALTDGATVQAKVRGVPSALADQWVLRQCGSEATDRPFGLDPCPTASSGAEGTSATAAVEVTRTVAGRNGPIDCAATPGRCSLELVVGNTVVATAPLSFTPPATTTTTTPTTTVPAATTPT